MTSRLRPARVGDQRLDQTLGVVALGLDATSSPSSRARGAGDRADRDHLGGAREAVAGGVEQVADGRRRGEGDVVGRLRGLERRRVGRPRGRSRRARRRRPGRRARAAPRAARRGPRRRGRPAPAGRARRRRRAPRPAPRRRSAPGRRRRSRRARRAPPRCPGRSRRRSRWRARARRGPEPAIASNSSRDAVRAGQADERVGVQVGDRVADLVGVDPRLDPDRRQLDDLGAERAQASRRGRSPERVRG